jgi:hypothetical protein
MHGSSFQRMYWVKKRFGIGAISIRALCYSATLKQWNYKIQHIDRMIGNINSQSITMLLLGNESSNGKAIFVNNDYAIIYRFPLAKCITHLFHIRIK